jgi:hypothetical protein
MLCVRQTERAQQRPPCASCPFACLCPHLSGAGAPASCAASTAALMTRLRSLPSGSSSWPSRKAALRRDDHGTRKGAPPPAPPPPMALACCARASPTGDACRAPGRGLSLSRGPRLNAVCRPPACPSHRHSAASGEAGQSRGHNPSRSPAMALCWTAVTAPVWAQQRTAAPAAPGARCRAASRRQWRRRQHASCAAALAAPERGTDEWLSRAAAGCVQPTGAPISLSHVALVRTLTAGGCAPWRRERR